jgi:hypothetical protein
VYHCSHRCGHLPVLTGVAECVGGGCVDLGADGAGVGALGADEEAGRAFGEFCRAGLLFFFLVCGCNTQSDIYYRVLE